MLEKEMDLQMVYLFSVLRFTTLENAQFLLETLLLRLRHIYYPPGTLNMKVSINSVSTTPPRFISFHQPYSLNSGSCSQPEFSQHWVLWDASKTLKLG